MTIASAFDQARAVAQAVLYEGYLLYPYRASAAKNRARWQFGVLVPGSYADTGTGEHTTSRTECLAIVGPGARLSLRVRFLQAQHRTVHAAALDGYHPVSVLTVDGDDVVPWDEAVEQEWVFSLSVAALLAGEQVHPIDISGGQDVERVAGGRVVRTRHPLTARLRCHAERLGERDGGADGRDGQAVVRISVTLTNTCPVDCETFDRARALRHSLISAHTVMTLTGGEFMSMTDPPAWALDDARHCVNDHTWPVLIGPEGEHETMLSSPIILSDYPRVDPRSRGDFYDACEIDELLMLRTLTLTDEEKRAVRATDDRARQLLDRVHELPAKFMAELHGTVSYLDSTRTGGPESTGTADTPWWRPGGDADIDPDTDTVLIGGQRIGRGSRVILRPRPNGDAQDVFLAGLSATVHAVLRDVDETTFLAVTVDGDPAAEWQVAQRRYRYFRTDEVQPAQPAEHPVRTEPDTAAAVGVPVEVPVEVAAERPADLAADVATDASPWPWDCAR